MESEGRGEAIELRRVEDRSGATFYVFLSDDTSFVSDVDGLENNLAEITGVRGEDARTIIHMAVEGYIVRYYPLEKRVTAEVVFQEDHSGKEE